MADESASVALPRDRASSMRSAARGSTLNLLGAVMSALGTFGLTVVVTRGAPQVYAGVFFATTSLFVLVTAVGRLGTDTGLVYFISQARALGQMDRFKAYVLAAARPAVICGVALGVALFIFAAAIAVKISPENTELAETYLRSLAPFIPFAGLAYVALAATRGLGTMKPYAFTEQLVRPGLQLVLAVAIVTLGNSVALAWSWSVPYLVSAVLSLILLRHYFKSRVEQSQNTQPRGREFWRFTAPRSFASIMQIAMQRLDIILVAVLAGATAAAIYTAATRFIVLGQFARNAVSMAVQPQIASAMAVGNRSEIRGLYRTSTAWIMACTWPIFLVLLVEGSTLLKIFGHGYAVGTGVLALLSLAMLIATFCGDVDIMLVMSGRSRQSLVNNAVALVLMVGLDLAMVPHLGLLGAAIGWSSAIICKNIAALVQVWWAFRVWPFGKAPLNVAIASLVCFGVGVGAPKIIFGSGFSELLLGGIVACIAYGLWIWAMRGVLALGSLNLLRTR